MRERFFVHGPQSFDRRIGIRGRLKVRQEVVALRYRSRIRSNALIDLAEDARARQPAAGAEAAVVAKRAATGRNCAVHIGAGKTGVDANLLHPAAEPLPKEEVARKIRQPGISPGEPSFARRKSFG